MASFMYQVAKKRMADGDLVWNSDTIKVMFLVSGYAGDEDDNDLTAAAAAEASGTGYITGPGGSGRKTISNKSTTRDDTANIAQFIGDPVAWTGLSGEGSIVAIVVYEHISGADDSLNFPIRYIDDGGFPISDPAGDVTITPASTGWIKLD